MNIIFQIINNSEDIYQGELRYYHKLAFNAKNSANHYHNYRHSMHVMCSVYEGAKFIGYPERAGEQEFRALLIASMHHDYGHSGIMGSDAQQISNTLANLHPLMLEKDLHLWPLIEKFIVSTQFPHHEGEVSEGEGLIRDADLSQIFSEIWMQQIVFGLSVEMKISPVELLCQQPSFLRSLKFHSKWGNLLLQPKIAGKIREITEMISLVE
ncbi:MAG: hypothetical protein NT165_01420 [Candidatus Falkowbacteria bacterium]|nr:hypothetical protein [Candidatus Falkowbacteria bacterium]